MPLPVSHPLYTYYSQYESQLSSAYSYIGTVSAQLLTASYFIPWSDPAGETAFNNARVALTNYMRFAIGSNYTPDRWPQLLFMENEYDYWGGDTLDMDAILNAMVSASYAQLTQFVGIEDAYRSAIWDQPFNSQFYAALANGFRP